jgi:hypothetical protein
LAGSLVCLPLIAYQAGRLWAVARELVLDVAQDLAVAIQVSSVAANERGGAFPDRRRRARPGIAPRQDAAVEHRDERRPFPVQPSS